MSGTTTRQLTGVCGANGCAKTSTAAMDARGRWVDVSGEVYASERRSLVVHSWAGSCEQHADQVSAAVRADIEEWAERWQIVRRTRDYDKPATPAEEQIDASGHGTPAGWTLF